MSPVPRDDPNKDSENHLDVGAMETPQFILAAEESDSDGEDMDMGGYQLLPQEPETMETNSLQDNDRASPDTLNENVAPSHGPLDHAVVSSLENFTTASLFQSELPPPPSTDASERRDLWQTTEPEAESPVMDPEHADKIQQAMAGFTLPAHAIPAWARVIPEEDWKAQLFAKLQGTPSTATKCDSNRTCNSRTCADSSSQSSASETTKGGAEDRL